MNELPGSEQIAGDPAFPVLKSHVLAQTGLAYFRAREADLATRIRRRMVATASPNCTAYLELLRDPRRGEQDALVHELTIGETHFFRFAEQFEALRRLVLPALLRQNQDRRQLRLWSAGCSIGPEVYSLAILLEREFGTQLHDWSVSIVGTDIDLEFLERARAGVYAEWALRGLPEPLRRECFTPTSEGWRLDRRYQRWTSFAQHNLAQDALPPVELRLGSLDLILCRNVMIYFDETTITRVVGGLQRTLAPEGWLLVGHAEGNSDAFRSFKTHHLEGTVLFQNTPGASASWSPQTPGTSLPKPSIFGVVDLPSTGSPIEQLQTWRPYRLDAEAPVTVPVASPSVPEAGARDPFIQVRALVDQGRWAAADEQLQQLLAREPLNPLAHYYQGLIFAQWGRPVESEAALRRALFLEPALPLAYYHLGLLLETRGAHVDAQKAFRNTLRAVENIGGDLELAGSDLTVARLREAALLQLGGRKS